MNLSIRPSVLLLGAALLSACTPAADLPIDPDTPLPCSQRAEAASYDCVEEDFWSALGQADLGPRRANEQLLVQAITRFPSPALPQRMAIVHFRLGQLRLAMALENQQNDYVIQSDKLIVGEFRTAMQLDPANGIIAPWMDAMEIAVSAILEDWVKAKELAERGFANVAKDPVANILSLSGTTIGFPLDTGVPQRTVEHLDKWECQGPAFCTQNTPHAPFARPGLGYHLAEAYARVGERQKARQHLDAALAAAGAERWPYRPLLSGAANNLDGFLKSFADLGQSGSAFRKVYANQPFGCLFCHARP